MAAHLCYQEDGALDMKLSIVLSTQPASFSALAYRGELAANINKIAGLGYDGVELAVRDPRLLNMDVLNSSLKEAGLPVPAIGTGQAYGEEGLSFTNPDSDIRGKAIERIKAQIELAEVLNAVVIIGLIRGKIEDGVTKEKAEEWMLAAFDECARFNPNVRLAIEPINRYETDLLNTVPETLGFLDKLRAENVGALLDTFHMNIEEPSPIESIQMAGDRIFHFHVADSNRWYPGAGHIDFLEISRLLKQIGYQGFVSAEIMPLPDPDTSAQKTMDTMLRIRSEI